MDDNMNKRLVVILCCFFVISIVLLGASFAQESGQDKVLSTTQDVSDNMRVIYSSKTVNKDNKVYYNTITNSDSKSCTNNYQTSVEESDYYISQATIGIDEDKLCTYCWSGKE